MPNGHSNGTKVGEPLAFIYQAIRTNTNDCILWPYNKTTGGYGKCLYQGRQTTAHRIALILKTGIEPAKDACHGPCHNRLCINPNHLSWKSRIDNIKDRYRDGSHQLGSQNASTHLTELDVLDIHDRYWGGTKQKELASEYGVGQQTISRIVNGLRWAHI